jgi:hypothetical protein
MTLVSLQRNSTLPPKIWHKTEAAGVIRLRAGQGRWEVVGDGVLLSAVEPEWAAFDGLLFSELQGKALELDERFPPEALERARKLVVLWRRYACHW